MSNYPMSREEQDYHLLAINMRLRKPNQRTKTKNSIGHYES